MAPGAMPALAWYDVVGLGGTLAILGAYALLQAGRLRGDGFPYQLLNLVGAAGILVSLAGAFNLSVFLLETAWVIVSLYGMLRSFRARRRTPTNQTRTIAASGKGRAP